MNLQIWPSLMGVNRWGPWERTPIKSLRSLPESNFFIVELWREPVGVG